MKLAIEMNFNWNLCLCTATLYVIVFWFSIHRDGRCSASGGAFRCQGSDSIGDWLWYRELDWVTDRDPLLRKKGLFTLKISPQSPSQSQSHSQYQSQSPIELGPSLAEPGHPPSITATLSRIKSVLSLWWLLIRKASLRRHSQNNNCGHCTDSRQDSIVARPYVFPAFFPCFRATALLANFIPGPYTSTRGRKGRQLWLP